MSPVVSVENTTANQTSASTEWTLQVWRSAAQAVATDPNVERRHAYEAAIGEMLTTLPANLTMQELAARFWSESLMMLAARVSVRRDGRVLNAQVIAAAACWRQLSYAVAGQ